MNCRWVSLRQYLVRWEPTTNARFEGTRPRLFSVVEEPHGDGVFCSSYLNGRHIGCCVWAGMLYPEPHIGSAHKNLEVTHHGYGKAGKSSPRHASCHHCQDCCTRSFGSAFQEGVKLNPEFAPNRSFLAVTYAKLGELERAQSELVELMRIHPELATMSEEESIAALPYRRTEDTRHFLEAMALVQ